MEDRKRRSIRLKEYDYSQPGAYFVTLCTHERECLLGEVARGAVQLNEYGCIAERKWSQTACVRPNVRLDAFVVMPNHLHGIVVISDRGTGVLQYAPTPDPPSFRSPSQTLGAIVRGFKSATTKRINQIRQMPSAPIWQRNYYEHVIRTEAELDRIREYIFTNPARWEYDENNPDTWR